MRDILENHEIDLGDLLLAVCFAALALGLFFS